MNGKCDICNCDLSGYDAITIDDPRAHYELLICESCCANYDNLILDQGDL